MNRTVNLLVPYILRLVTTSLSADTEEHRQSLVHPNTALYTVLTPSTRLLKNYNNKNYNSPR
jgi:hypothetical protein